MPLDFSTISAARINKVSTAIRGIFVSEFTKVRGTATGDTLRSINVKVVFGQPFVTWEVYAGEGYVWAQRGKRANTKLPVKKTGNGWELVAPLKRWHAIKTPSMPEFVLARAIARKARAPIPITARADQRISPIVGTIIMGKGGGLGESILTTLVDI
jgi:hypothetical protein